VRAENLNATNAPYLRRIDLDETEQALLRALGSRVAGDPYTDFEAFYDEIKALRRQVPARVREELWAFRDAERGGAVLIDGVPLDEVPPTPDRPFTHAPIFDMRTEIPLALLAV